MSAPIQPSGMSSTPAVGAALRDLTALALEGQLGPLIGRGRELEQVIRILLRRTRRNAVLIGESGVGKTAIVEGLAQRISSGAVPPGLAGRKLLAIDAAALLAPRRSLDVAPDSADAILFIHGLFDIAAAGYSWSVLEAMRILEPMLARAALQAIATGTPAGYREIMDKAAPLGFQFEVVPVLPPGDEEAAAILRGVKAKYEQFHDVTFSDEAIEAAIAASARFLRHRSLPDRALDLLDEAGAHVSLQRAAGGSAEEREIRRRLRIVSHKMDTAIAMHDFQKARELSRQEEADKQSLRQLLAQQKMDDAPSGVVAASDIVEVVAGRVGAPVPVIENLMRRPDAGGLERIVKELIALVPQGREWLEPLAAYLAGCAPEDVEKLAAAILHAREKAQKE
jgi:ATP-dependent Clp protease ATP-binding subunit ClpC